MPRWPKKEDDVNSGLVTDLVGLDVLITQPVNFDDELLKEIDVGIYPKAIRVLVIDSWYDSDGGYHCFKEGLIVKSPDNIKTLVDRGTVYEVLTDNETTP